ncbi:unnamed protein product, partial [Soboliphyme baturini]|uniref:DUF1716 domain-containing protein n=1 Tax=Soboliphyme baturini TaxID=241478 RepID=A0A183IC39_9BILA
MKIKNCEPQGEETSIQQLFTWSSPVSKRPRAESSEDVISFLKKPKQSDPAIHNTASLPEESLSVLSNTEEQVDVMDENGVKKMILNFEKKILKNQEMRIKFPDQPTKFMDSELDLNVAIQEMHAVATVPHLYYLLVQFKAVESLLQLLSHENSDISVAVVDLLQ